jgi:RNA polymerase sigma factor (sigma-70 family)
VAQDDASPLDPAVRQRVRRKVHRLVGRQGLTQEDAEDIEQELLAHLFRRLAEFDPGRGQRDNFVATLIRRFLINLLRDRRAARRDYRRTTTLDVPAGNPKEPEETQAEALGEQAHDARLGRQGRSAEEQADLAMDVAEVLARLPAELQVVARQLLESGSVSEAAREQGVRRTTLQDRVRHLREIFEQSGLRLYR